MQTDVLIIGAGLSGIVAADEIIQNSTLSVLQLSSGSGASPFIHGFCLPVGEGDSEELFFEDSMKSGYGQSDPALVKRLCFDCLSLSDYFNGLGLSLDRDEKGYSLIHSLGSAVPRIASIQNNTGAVLLNRLQKRLDESPRYKCCSGQRALALIREGDRVIGARCYDTREGVFHSIYAKTVILALADSFPNPRIPVTLAVTAPLWRIFRALRLPIWNLSSLSRPRRYGRQGWRARGS